MSTLESFLLITFFISYWLPAVLRSYMVFFPCSENADQFVSVSNLSNKKHNESRKDILETNLIPKCQKIWSSIHDITSCPVTYSVKTSSPLLPVSIIVHVTWSQSTPFTYVFKIKSIVNYSIAVISLYALSVDNVDILYL